MSRVESKLIIWGVIIGGSILVCVVKMMLRSAKGRTADRALDNGDVDKAIVAYRNQLLGVLELGSGSMNDDDPGMLISDAEGEGRVILEKLVKAYEKARIPFYPDPYDQFVCRLEALVENRDNFGFTGMKGAAKKEFKQIRREFAEFVKNGGLEAPTLPASAESGKAATPSLDANVARKEAQARPAPQKIHRPVAEPPVSSAPAAKPWKLSLYQGGEHLLSRLLTPGSYTLGRDDAADFVLEDDAVSRRHLVIRLTDDGRLSLADTGSSNGTWKEGRDRIEADEPQCGSWYQMGKAQLLFSRSAEEG